MQSNCVKYQKCELYEQIQSENISTDPNVEIDFDYNLRVSIATELYEKCLN